MYKVIYLKVMRETNSFFLTNDTRGTNTQLSSHICRKKKWRGGEGDRKERGGVLQYSDQCLYIYVLLSRRRAIGGGIDMSKFNSIVELQFTDQNTYL